MSNIKCPYCGSNNYAKSSKIKGSFKDWKAVRNHTSSCTSNNGEYYIDEMYGSIHFTEIQGLSVKVFRNTFDTKATLYSIKKAFITKGFIVTIKTEYTKQDCILDIQKFYKENNRIPQHRDFDSHHTYVSNNVIKRRFGSWNKGIEAAGFIDVKLAPVYLSREMVDQALDELGERVDISNIPGEALEKTVFSAKITTYKPSN